MLPPARRCSRPGIDNRLLTELKHRVSSPIGGLALPCGLPAFYISVLALEMTFKGCMNMSEMGKWLRQGWRSAWLQSPHWPALRAGPALLLQLLLADVLLALLFERLYIAGPAQFWWPSLLDGRLGTLLAAFVCWALCHGVPPADDSIPPPAASALLAMLLAQGAALTLLWGPLFVLLIHTGWLASISGDPLGRWVSWALPLLWSLMAAARLLWRHTPPRPRRLAGALLLCAGLGLQHWLQPARHWFEEQAPEQAALAPLALTQDVWEAQPRLLHSQLQALQPQRAGVVDVYAITFAPYADEDVFKRESALVAALMEQRFGALGRSLQLVNHRDTAQTLPWATPNNLRRALSRAAEQMDRDEDLLFIHLTSHGARDGQLAAALAPLTLQSLTPQQLQTWLEELGIRHAVISISACYSGSWITPLAGPGRLVMTAADADHTSYGCGRGSELTYFGRAMFDEQLRNNTRDFEQAHAAARVLIEQREVQAGKSDGFSNPQISVGEAIRPLLARLAAQAAAPP